MKDFVIFRHPKEEKIQAFVGTWQVQSFNLDKETFWIKPFEDDQSIFSLNNASKVQWTNINLEVGQELHEEPIEDGSANFVSYIGEILSAIGLGRIKKAVPARRSFVRRDIFSLEELFVKNMERNPEAFCYLLYGETFGFWMGASPEMFFHYTNEVGESMSLAGTRGNADTRSFGKKEFEEQGIVSSYIQQILSNFATEVRVEAAKPMEAAHLSHLHSRVTCKINKSKIPELLDNLHPTPAVGGVPRKESLNIIDKHEDFSRGLYSGWLGQTENGRLRSYVNLRCAQVFKNGMLCYAGCGVNKGSDPLAEFEETESKMRVMKDLLNS